jgi:hypothetical protein
VLTLWDYSHMFPYGNSRYFRLTRRSSHRDPLWAFVHSDPANHVRLSQRTDPFWADSGGIFVGDSSHMTLSRPNAAVHDYPRVSYDTHRAFLTLFAFRFAMTPARLTLGRDPMHKPVVASSARVRMTLSVLAFGATENYREVYWVTFARIACVRFCQISAL